MTALWWTWGISAAAMMGLGAWAGLSVKGTPLGLLIDNRERYSLARFNVVWWTLIVLSLCAGVAAARFTVGGADPLGFTIPAKVLALVATVGVTTLGATVVKARKNRYRDGFVSASLPGGGFLAQMLLQEEGAGSDQALDVGKFQALVVTVLLGAGYVLTAVYDLLGRGTPPIKGPAGITSLPDLDATFVALLAISAASYVGTKAVPRGGQPPLSLAERNTRQTAQRLAVRQVDGRLAMDARREYLRERAANIAASRAASVPPGDRRVERVDGVLSDAARANGHG